MCILLYSTEVLKVGFVSHVFLIPIVNNSAANVHVSLRLIKISNNPCFYAVDPTRIWHFKYHWLFLIITNPMKLNVACYVGGKHSGIVLNPNSFLLWLKPIWTPNIVTFYEVSFYFYHVKGTVYQIYMYPIFMGTQCRENDFIWRNTFKIKFWCVLMGYRVFSYIACLKIRWRVINNLE